VIGIFLDWLLGSRCLKCGERVFPKGRADHDAREHAYL
jgi:hypothetical protein